MKSVRSSSYFSNNKDTKRRNSSRKSSASTKERPTPLDFDAFIPWFCIESQIPVTVTVTRKKRAVYISYRSKMLKEGLKASKSKVRSSKIKSNIIKSDNIDKKPTELSECETFTSSACKTQDVIPVTTYYDKSGNLVEISIIGCPFPIHRKVIQAFNICLPFHLELAKFSIRKGGLSNVILHEICKLLPHSNITEVCLDDSFVSGGKYSVLLEQPIQLKYLSLKRCGINDDECKNIASKLDIKGSAVKHLLLLDLTSNEIMDEGAKALGEALKSNRYLLYLNLSGNYISDTGAAFILKYLIEFPLEHDDILGKWNRKLNYLKCRTSTFNKCLEETNFFSYFNGESPSSVKEFSKQLHRKAKISISPKETPKTSIEKVAEKKMEELLGDFEDPFNEEYVKRKDNLLFSIGNFTLCSLNLSYNNITHHSVKMLVKVLKYQSGINKTSQGTGLLRVVIDGNKIISPCNKLDELDIYLQSVLKESKLNM